MTTKNHLESLPIAIKARSRRRKSRIEGNTGTLRKHGIPWETQATGGNTPDLNKKSSPQKSREIGASREKVERKSGESREEVGRKSGGSREEVGRSRTEKFGGMAPPDQGHIRIETVDQFSEETGGIPPR